MVSIMISVGELFSFCYNKVSLRSKDVVMRRKGPHLPNVSNLINTFLMWCNFIVKIIFQPIWTSFSSGEIPFK